MATSTLTKRLRQLAAKNGTPKGTDLALFNAFLSAAAPQIRTAFRARNSEESVFKALSTFFHLAQRNKTSDPVVVVEATESGTLIKSHMPDQAFIVDTVLLTLQALGISYQTGFNLVLGMGRDEGGLLTQVDDPANPLESLIYVVADATEDTAALQTAIEQRLRLAQAVVSGFEPITNKVTETAHTLMRANDKTETDVEVAAFLRWLLADNFVFMGLIHGKTHLGIAKKAVAKLNNLKALKAWSGGDHQVSIRKGPTESKVHRAGRMDEICVRLSDGTEIKLQGLFTYRAVTQPSRHVPILRQTLTQILDNQDCKPSSYQYKGISNVFDSLPTEFLFTTQPNEIAEMIDRVLEAEQERKARAHILQATEDGSAFVLAAMPRGRWSDEVRAEIENTLIDATGASYCDHGVFVGRYDTMLIHFYLTGCNPLDDQDSADLSAEVMDIAAGWPERIRVALTDECGAEKAEGLSLRYGAAFEDMYQRMTSPAQAARDIQLLEAVSESNRVLADVYQDDRDRLSLRMYQLHNILLSEMLPVLDNFGRVILDQVSDPVNLADGSIYTIDTFS